MKPLFALAIALSMVVGAARAAPDVTATGFWQQTDDQGRVGAWFYFAEKNGVFEGRLVKTFPKPGVPNIPNCLKCEGDQKNAPMLGLVIVKKMQRNGLKYENGSILDPRDGSVYHARMEISPDGQKLFVRGYLGIEVGPDPDVDTTARHRDGPRGYPPRVNVPRTYAKGRRGHWA